MSPMSLVAYLQITNASYGSHRTVFCIPQQAQQDWIAWRKVWVNQDQLNSLARGWPPFKPQECNEQMSNDPFIKMNGMTWCPYHLCRHLDLCTTIEDPYAVPPDCVDKRWFNLVLLEENMGLIDYLRGFREVFVMNRSFWGYRTWF